MRNNKNIFLVMGEWQQQMMPKMPSLKGMLSKFRWFLPNGGTLIIAILMIFTQSVWAKEINSPASAPSGSATTINYQGRLANSDGTPVADNNYAISFAIFDAASGGNLVWPQNGPEVFPAVPVRSGLFSVALGSQTPGGITTTTWNGDRYLEITIGGETLSPRELIRGVPVAGMALTVPDASITRSKLANDVKISVVDTGYYYAHSSMANWNLTQGTGERIYRVHATFGKKFSAPPAVTVSLSSFDLSPTYGQRLAVYAENITKDGFDIVVLTWADTVVYAAGVTWLAHGN